MVAGREYAAIRGPDCDPLPIGLRDRDVIRLAALCDGMGGTLGDWPDLLGALRRRGCDVTPETPAAEVRVLCLGQLAAADPRLLTTGA